ncbi:hypothetical protein AMTRI_Chr12g271730 [Amborella trichopoda]
MLVRLSNSIFFFVTLFLYSFPSVRLCEYRRIAHNVILIIRVMIHQPASSFYEAPAEEFFLAAGELLKLRETITCVYVQRTGNPLWVVSEDMERASSFYKAPAGEFILQAGVIETSRNHHKHLCTSRRIYPGSGSY